MTNIELVEELRRWARARDYCNKRREEQGKELLDSGLLLEAASRLEGVEQPPVFVKAPVVTLDHEYEYMLEHAE